VDVVKHPEYDLWIPEMIFANLHQLRQDREENRRRENVRVQTRAHLVGVRVNRDDRPRQGAQIHPVVQPQPRFLSQ
jgi:hypothetical protein